MTTSLSYLLSLFLFCSQLICILSNKCANELLQYINEDNKDNCFELYKNLRNDENYLADVDERDISLEDAHIMLDCINILYPDLIDEDLCFYHFKQTAGIFFVFVFVLLIGCKAFVK